VQHRLNMLKFAVLLGICLAYASAASILAVYAPLNQVTDTGFTLGLLDPNNPSSSSAKPIKSFTAGTLVNPLYPNIAYDPQFYNATFVVSYNYGESFAVLEVSTVNGSIIRNVSDAKIGFFSGLQYDTTDNYVYTACLNANFAWGVCRFTILGKIPMIVPFPDIPINLWSTSYSVKNNQFIALAEKAQTYGEVVLWFANVQTRKLDKEVPVKVGGSLGLIAYDDASGTLYGWVNDPNANTATLYTVDTTSGNLSKPLVTVANATAFGTQIAIDPVSKNVTTILNTGSTTKNPIVINYNPASGAYTRATTDLRIAGFQFIPSSFRKTKPILHNE
jgi:hypothetical protein